MTRLKTLSRVLKVRYEALPRALQIVAIGLAFGMVALVINTAVVRLQSYRAQMRAEVDANRERVNHLHAYVARAEQVERERELLTERLQSLQDRFLPGDTGTLAAAHLQDHVTTVAGDTGVSVQSAQVMREEEVGEYRRITVRLTLRSTVKALADFLEKIEYGSMQLSVPFLQIDGRGGTTPRRGAATANVAAERVLSATLEVRGLTAGGAVAPEAAGKS
jgi:hypothetical protein